MTQEEYKDEVRRIRPKLLSVARRYVGDDDAEDTVQDVLLRLWQMLDELRLPVDALATVLVRNQCVSQLRKQRHAVALPATIASDGFSVGVATDSTDVNAFTLAGLLPNTKYELYFFSRALTNAPPATAKSIVRGTFTAGGVTAVSAKTWFADSYGEYARLDVRSNADGEIAGTFRSASATGSAFWCGLQILGPGFSRYIPKGATIIFR